MDAGDGAGAGGGVITTGVDLGVGAGVRRGFGTGVGSGTARGVAIGRTGLGTDVAFGPTTEGELACPAGVRVRVGLAVGAALPAATPCDAAGVDPAESDSAGTTFAGADVAARTPPSGAGLGWDTRLTTSAPTTPTSSTSDVSRQRRRRGEKTAAPARVAPRSAGSTA